MGQLDVYSIDDISLITLIMGPISTYLSEEVEVSIESIVAYIYSTNSFTKKCNKLIVIERPAGDIAGAIYKSWILVPLHDDFFLSIYKSLDERIMWQDPALSQWEGKADRANLARLDTKYSW